MTKKINWRRVPCSAKFLREFNFADGRVFLCFAGTNFCDWENCFFLLGISFCDFHEVALYFGIITFSFFEYKQSNISKQHADVSDVNQLISGVPSDDPFLQSFVTVKYL